MTRKSEDKNSKTAIVHDFVHDRQYQSWITDVSRRFRSSQIKAAMKVNDEMLRFYWALGRDIVSMKADSLWGNRFYEVLSKDLKRIIPESKGFSPRNLRYMRDYYLLFSSDSEILPQVVAKSHSDALEQMNQGGQYECDMWRGCRDSGG